MNEVVGFAGLGILLALIALRVPIGIALIGVSFCGVWSLIGLSSAVSMLRTAPYTFASNWQLSSIPMFLFMGFLCYHTGITRGLFQAARVWLSRLPGGLAIASVFGASGFAALSGSSIACSAAMGRIAVPEMMRARYDASISTGTVAAAGTIGALIPPSILFIVYGVLAQQPISQLFLAGAVAGLLTAAFYVAVILIWATWNKDIAPRVDETFTLRERIETLRAIIPAIVLAATVFGGLFSGVFTPTEAGAVGSGIAILVSIWMRTFTWKSFKNSVVESFATSASLFIIAIGAHLLTRFVVLSGADIALTDIILNISGDVVLLMIGIAVLYLALGMFIDPMGAMLLTLPILLPVAESANFNMIWFGIIVAKLLEIGMITPPVGLNVFVIKSVLGDSVKLTSIFRGVVPFLAADIVVVVLLMAFPSIVLFLPGLMGR